MVTTFVYIQRFSLPKTTDTYQYLRIQTFIHQHKLKKKSQIYKKNNTKTKKKNIFNSMLIRFVLSYKITGISSHRYQY